LPFEKHSVRGYLTSKALRTFDRAKTETFHFKIGSLLWQLAKPAYGQVVPNATIANRTVGNAMKF